MRPSALNSVITMASTLSTQDTTATRIAPDTELAAWAAASLTVSNMYRA